MKILVRRNIAWMTAEYAMGEMFLDGSPTRFCYTMEDAERDEKIKHETCIPVGLYKAIVTMSQRFKRRLLLLLGVANFDSIRVHNGVSKDDTSGCILVGFTKSVDRIGQSVKALDALMVLVEAALERGEDITVEVM